MKRFVPALLAVPVVLTLLHSPAPAQPPAAAASRNDPLQDEKPKDDPKLLAIGGLGGSAVYFSFLLVGTTADAFGKESYDADQVKTIVDSVMTLLKTNADQIAAVRRGGLTEEDDKYANELIVVLGMIRDYAKLLGDYAKGKDPKVAQKFDDQRKKTWERVKKLLGIK
ncbi:MAG: hypothetical protein HYY17_02700 [Planctomycetes bacterium]|nr:hypothetical protein [Planctomycetota bacterium]